MVAAVISVAVGILVGALAAAQFSADPPPETAAPAASTDKPTATQPPVQIPAVKIHETVLDASGYITARRTATVSAQVMGLIADVGVEEGMRVDAGQVLAQLDAAKAQVELELAQSRVEVLQAQVASIRANLGEAQRQRVRYAGLMDKNYSSRAELTQSEASVESLRAELASARADIRVAQLEVQRQREQLEDHTIRAPFAGVVTQKNAQPGEIVSPSSAGGGFTRTGICTIVDMDSLEIEVDVNEAFIGRVREGQKVSAQLDAYPEWEIPATVEAIIPTADRAKATVRVRIGIDESDPRILPDMGVKVAFLRTGE
ncbi:efflux RND transporter periplasmic adaptor subunit [Microbulbifer halophilus]|uniref:efflux RND transporter periplasmic adaptor subunit n=1 Tax=Microbulbifer halophilus TaxID=453963 RepID=UPI002244B3D6|nr:efflux RND transporter periplasmic adaptor subunit [Microbulbifer halophilus]